MNYSHEEKRTGVQVFFSTCEEHSDDVDKTNESYTEFEVHGVPDDVCAQ